MERRKISEGADEEQKQLPGGMTIEAEVALMSKDTAEQLVRRESNEAGSFAWDSSCGETKGLADPSQHGVSDF